MEVQVRGKAETDNNILGLATRRQKKGISLEQIADATKIGRRALQAIESGDFEKLPGGIYSTSYIRQYARAIDFDESQLLAVYYSKMGIKPVAGNSSESAAPAEQNPLARFLRQPSVLGS